ncbi:MAG: class I SAM-dependent methyltransferase [Nitrospirota bacterium]
MSVFYELRDFPVHTVLNIAAKAEAFGFRRGDIVLAFCRDCGFITNTAFKRELLEYGADCEESQGFSPTFRSFASGLGHELVERYQLRGKTILEIGCGKGEFLSMLCAYGHNQGVGFDPAYVEGRHEPIEGGSVRFIKDYYSEKYSQYQADFVCCQMTLEHIHQVGPFIHMVRGAIGNRGSTVVYFQVPDVTRILRDCAFEDIYYEHCSYFSPGSLARLFRKNGFDILDLRTEYDGQYLIIEARTAGANPKGVTAMENDLAQLEGYVSTFSRRVKEKLSSWRKSLDGLTGKRSVVWGSGSKGVAFLINLGLDKLVEYVVDINPHRQGMFMPGTGHEIVAPSALMTIRPDAVIVMNRVYEPEIKAELQKMGLNPKVLSL